MTSVNEVKKDCCGCGACLAICPVKAIHMEEKERGAIYYKIGDGCINCGKCKSVCPIENNLFHSEQSIFYRAVTKQKEVLRKSSSGGIAFELASMVIHEGGVVYGAGWSSKEQLVQHMRIDSLKQLSKLQGSKYVQSRINEFVYHDICEDIKSKKVLVIGCPCQIAAIRRYTKDNPNLMCIDLICHGVPSSKLLRDQLKLIVKEPIKSISFREGLKFRLDLQSACGAYSLEGLDNPYYSLYLHFASLRESCYKCKYASRNRVGDITLGDYVENNNGFSCIISNTKKGDKMIEKIRVVIELEERDTQLLNENHAYNMPTKKNPKTDKFTNLYNKHGLLYAYYMSFPIFVLKRMIRRILGEHIYTSMRDKASDK